jgi:hypothetical protein
MNNLLAVRKYDSYYFTVKSLCSSPYKEVWLSLLLEFTYEKRKRNKGEYRKEGEPGHEGICGVYGYMLSKS